MKGKFLRLISWICIVVMLSGMAACRSGKDAGQQAGQNTADATDKQTGGKTVQFNIFRNFGSPEYPEDGGRGKQEIRKALEKAGITGVDFKVTLASGNDYYTKLNLLASSGEIPDYFNLDIPTMTRFADEGLIVPVEDLLKQVPNARKMMNDNDIGAVTYKGHQYAIPVAYRPEPFNGPSVGGFIIRQDWLDGLGMKAPQTIEELYAVLKAFTQNDPDKNGKKDTYGLSGNKNTNFNAIFGAYGIIPGFWHERNGQIKQGWTLPEAKEVLTLLQQWYKEGLIDPEFPVMEQKQLEEKYINSKVGIYESNAFDVNPQNPVPASLLKVTPTAKLTMLTPPKGPKGLQGWPESAPAYGDIRGISAKCKNPELLMKLIDWSASEAPNGGFFLCTYGMEGEHYTFDKEKNRIKQTVGSYSDLYKNGFSNPIRFLQVVDRRWMIDPALDAMAIANTVTVKNEFWKTVPAMFDYPDLIGNTGTTGKLWSEYFVKIVTGSLPAGAWEEYVNRYYQQGGKIVEEQANKEWKAGKVK